MAVAIDRELESLIFGGTPKPKKERKTEPVNKSTIDQETEASLAARLGTKALGTVSAIGNVLDLPGSMVRDTLSLKNPLDQLLTPLSPENRTSGRDMLRNVGAVGKKDNWGNFAGGLATEIALDPLTYLSFGTSALGKAGQVGKAAGLMDNATTALAKTTSRNMAEVGSREARLAVSLEDLIKHSGPDALERATSAATAKGLDIADLMGEKLGGNVGIGLPFMDPIMTLGSNAKIGKAVDDFARSARYANVPGTEFKPIDSVMRLFDPKAQDMRTALGVELGKKVYDSKTDNRVRAKTDFANLANKIEAEGLADQVGGERIRSFMEVEKNRANMTPGEQEIFDQMSSNLESMVPRAKEYGVPAKTLKVDDGDYFPRQTTADIRTTTLDPGKYVNTRSGHQIGRKDFLNDLPEGTVESIVKPARDVDISKAISDNQSVEHIAGILKQKYGNVIPPTYERTIKTGAKAGTIEQRDRYKAMARWLGKLSPELRESGVFGNHAAIDYLGRHIVAEDAISAVKNIADFLAQPRVLLPPTKGVNKQGVKTVGDILRNTGIRMGDQTQGFGYQLLKAKGIDIGALDPKAAAKMLKGVAKMRVQEDFAHDIMRHMEAIKNPEAVNSILDFVDNVTNFWKGSLTTPWPAFHVRNLLSGQWMNMAAGMWSPRSVSAAKNLMQGQVVDGAKDIAEVKLLWKQRGGKGALDDQIATKLLGELAYGHGVIGKFSGEASAVAGNVGDRITHDLQDTLSGIPGLGRQAFDPLRVARKAVGMEKGTNLNPLAQRGVGGAMESKFGPMAAGEEVGHMGEGLNRLGPWLHQLFAGKSAKEAAERVGKTQAIYKNRNYSKVEQQFMSRVFPFYKFSRNMIPYMIKQFMEHPGGFHANTVRAMENARNPATFTPDHVAESAAIPIEGTPLEYITGKPKEGHDRYISGFGLPIEDILGFGPNARGVGYEALSRANPIIKAPLEAITGQSYFQKGRPIADMDSTTGRLMANVIGSDSPVRYPGSSIVDFLLGNSPLSRPLATANMVTDSRRGAGEKAVNLLTGVRTQDVSPAAKEALERNILSDVMKNDHMAKQFTRTYIPDEVKAAMSPAQQKQADDLQTLMNVLAQRAKERRLREEKLATK